MSLITRCPECSTAFRVVPAQLSARGGRVRCGKCAKVFDGVAHLAEDTPRPEPEEPSPQIGLFDPRGRPTPEASAVAARSGYANTATAPQLEATAPAVPGNLVTPGAPDAAHWALAAGLQAQVQPEFLEARPARREFRFAWGLLCLIAIAAMVTQALFHFRTELAVLFPEARPQLAIGCEILDCELHLPRRAELLSIESSDLQADSTRADVLVLNAVVRNRAPFAQEFPSLELTLNNERDEAVVRRVLSPADYLAGRRAEAGGIAAGGEESLRLHLEASKVRATGYRLYLFFP